MKAGCVIYFILFFALWFQWVNEGGMCILFNVEVISALYSFSQFSKKNLGQNVLNGAENDIILLVLKSIIRLTKIFKWIHSE